MLLTCALVWNPLALRVAISSSIAPACAAIHPSECLDLAVLDVLSCVVISPVSAFHTFVSSDG